MSYLFFSFYSPLNLSYQVVFFFLFILHILPSSAIYHNISDPNNHIWWCNFRKVFYCAIANRNSDLWAVLSWDVVIDRQSYTVLDSGATSLKKNNLVLQLNPVIFGDNFQGDLQIPKTTLAAN